MKQTVRPIYASAAMVLVVLANAYILGSVSEAGRDAWLCLLLSALVWVPVLRLYAALSARYPGENFAGILEKSMSAGFARTLACFYTLYGVLVLGMSLNCFGLFAAGELLPDTPMPLMECLIAGTAGYLVWKGSGIMGKWAALVLPVALLFILLSLAGAIPVLEPEAVLPVAAEPGRIRAGFLRCLAFPLGEPVLLFTFLPGVRGRFRLRHWLLPFGTAILLLSLSWLRNVMVLGGGLYGGLRYAASYADGVQDYLNFAQHVEALTSLIPAAAGIMEAAAALSFAVDCLTCLTAGPRRSMYIPIAAILGLGAGIFLFADPAVLRLRDVVWPWISLPLQIIPPLVCLICPRAQDSRKKLERCLKRMTM